MFNRQMEGWWRWNIFWWKVEGVDPLNGINVIHPNDPSSAGFVIKVGPVGFRVRYSKRVKKWFIGVQRYILSDTRQLKWSLDFESARGSGIKPVDDHREYNKKEERYE